MNVSLSRTRNVPSFPPLPLQKSRRSFSAVVLPPASRPWNQVSDWYSSESSWMFPTTTKKEFMSEQFLKVAYFLTGVELTGFYKDNDCNLLPIPYYCLPPTSLLNSTVYYPRSHSHACKTSTLEKNIYILWIIWLWIMDSKKKQITFKLIENTLSIESQMQSSPSFSTTMFSLAFLICVEMWKYEKPPRKTSLSSFDTYF